MAAMERWPRARPAAWNQPFTYRSGGWMIVFPGRIAGMETSKESITAHPKDEQPTVEDRSAIANSLMS